MPVRRENGLTVPGADMYHGLLAHRQNATGRSLVWSKTDNFTDVHLAAFIGSTICRSRVRAKGRERPICSR